MQSIWTTVWIEHAFGNKWESGKIAFSQYVHIFTGVKRNFITICHQPKRHLKVYAGNIYKYLCNHNFASMKLLKKTTHRYMSPYLTFSLRIWSLNWIKCLWHLGCFLLLKCFSVWTDSDPCSNISALTSTVISTAAEVRVWMSNYTYIPRDTVDVLTYPCLISDNLSLLERSHFVFRILKSNR